MKQALISWQGGLAFDGSADSGHVVRMDAPVKSGGQDSGIRPSELLLLGLGGCTGVDVVNILNKMRLTIDKFEVAIEADSADEHPKHYTAFRIVYRLWGDVPADKFRKAVELSESTYCSVSALYKKAGAGVSYRLELNGEPLPAE